MVREVRWIAVAIALLSMQPANAEDSQDFYKGKTLTIIVGFGVGGGYDSYARLLANGLCNTGYVPRCFGEFYFPCDWINRYASNEQPQTALSARRILRHLFNDTLPPIALLLEFIPDTVPLTAYNITHSIAIELLDRLDAIHDCHVLHMDTHLRNILLSKSRGPVWVRMRYTSSLWTRR